MINFAILASGKGSNAQKLLEKSKTLYNVNPKVIITDKPNAGVINIANQYKLPIKIIEKKNLSKFEHEIEILKVLNSYNVKWLFLAGYMRVLSPEFLRRFYDNYYQTSRIINIHPSLLPSYKGLHAFERAYSDGISESGITVHFVNEDVDSGEIILQEKFQRKEHDSLVDFISRGQKLEHKLFPKVLELLDNNQLFNMREL